MHDSKTLAILAIAGTLASCGLLGVLWLFELGAISGGATLVFGFCFALVWAVVFADLLHDL